VAAAELDAERSDLLAMLAGQRRFLRYTTRDLTDEQASSANPSTVRRRWAERS